MAYGDTEDLTRDEVKFRFEDPMERSKFIRNVFAILTGQLMFTFFFVLLCSTNDELKYFLYENIYLMYVAMGITFVMVIALTCCEKTRKQPPWNYICLGIFTAAQTLLLCFLTLRYRTSLILIALGMTAVVCLAATGIACFSKWDFTSSGLMCFLGILTFVLLIFSLVMMFVPHTPILVLIFASFGAILFSIWLIVDIQLMIGGNHTNVIAPDDYVFAALSIYIDIINIFQYILIILGVLDR